VEYCGDRGGVGKPDFIVRKICKRIMTRDKGRKDIPRIRRAIIPATRSKAHDPTKMWLIII
jgi:hypothetical protein